MSTPHEPTASELENLKKEFPFRFKSPRVHPTAWVAPGAQVWGDVEIGEWSGIWFNTVARGDVNYIRIGARTNIQDLSLIHVTSQGNPTIIGDDVTVGHSCVIHACTVGNFSLVGMGSVLLDGAELGEFVLLGAGSLVTANTKIPPYTKAFGRPAKPVKELTPAEVEHLKFSAGHYVKLLKTYR